MHPLTALDLCGGVARWSRLAAMGVGRGRLIELVRAGDVARPGRGVFCRPELVGAPQVVATVAAGQLTCAAGAMTLGLDTWRPVEESHVRTAAGPRARRGRGPAVLHPWGLIGSGRTAPVEVVLHDCAACLPVVEAVVVIDSALRSRLVEPSDWPGIIGAGPHAARVRRVLGLADTGSQSVLESVARTTLRGSGVSDVASQVWFQDVGWVDLVVNGWLVIELDGRTTHAPAFQEDRRRDAELTRRGLVVLRFTYADLMHGCEWFVEVVRETLDRGRPPFADVSRRGLSS